MELHLTRHTGPDTLALVPKLKLLYADAYAEPPYEIQIGRAAHSAASARLAPLRAEINPDTPCVVGEVRPDRCSELGPVLVPTPLHPHPSPQRPAKSTS